MLYHFLLISSFKVIILGFKVSLFDKKLFFAYIMHFAKLFLAYIMHIDYFLNLHEADMRWVTIDIELLGKESHPILLLFNDIP